MMVHMHTHMHAHKNTHEESVTLRLTCMGAEKTGFINALIAPAVAVRLDQGL